MRWHRDKPRVTRQHRYNVAKEEDMELPSPARRILLEMNPLYNIRT
jgi:hypothetical protein